MADVFSVAVFAHNEQRRIARCLETILDGQPASSLQVHVLINGSTDGTERTVRDAAARDPRIIPQMIKIGDKSNAWNEYVHRLSGEATTHFFVDGDVFLSKGALGVLHRGLAGTPDANASTGVPGNGRNSGNWSALITRDHGIAGNLYALRGTFVDRIRKANIRLPTGLIGDDSWVGAYVLFDLDVARGWIKERAVVCLDATFQYDSLSYFNADDWRLYWRRRIRYAARSIQNEGMKRLIHSRGIRAVPHDVRGLYREYPDLLQLHWAGLDTPFRWLALQRIGRELDNDSEAG